MADVNVTRSTWGDMKAPDVKRPYILSMILSVAVLAVVVIAAGVSLWQSRQAQIKVAGISLQYQARALGDKINASLNEPGYYLNNMLINAHIESAFTGEIHDDFVDYITRFTSKIDTHIQIKLFDARGRSVAIPGALKFDPTPITTAPYFLKHKEQYFDFVMEIIPPVGQGATPVISMSRPVLNANGEFLGIVQVNLDASSIKNTLVSDEFGGFEHAALLDLSGDPIVTWPPVDPNMGKDDTALDPSTEHEQITQNINASSTDTDYTVVYKIQNYPLSLKLSRSYRDILVSWTLELRNLTLIGLALGAGILGFNIFIYRRMKIGQQREMILNRFFFAVEQSSASVMITDVQGCIEYVNPWFCHITGYTRDDVYGLKPSILKSGHTTDEEYAALWQAITHGKQWHCEFLNCKKNGDLYWEAALISPLLDLDGNISNFVSIKEDITERKKIEFEVRHQRQRLEEIIWGTNIGTWEWNIKTGAVEINERWAEIIGYTLEELAPISIETWNTHTHPDDLAKSATLLKIHFSGKTNHYEVECRMRHKNGEWVWVQDRGKVVEWDQNGNPLRMSGTHADITKRKEAEQQLELAKMAAESANLAKSEFLSSMSHELRTPLNAILGFAQILELTPSEPLTPKQKDSTDQILKGGEHLLNLINDVLNLARIETGKLDLEIEPVDLQNVLEECLSVASVLTKKLNITITTEDFSGAIVLADRVRLKQVIFNLLSNAVKYNRENGRVDVSSMAIADSWYRVSIIDTGRGIPADKHKELFEPFARLGAENSIIEGTGIGLTITKRLLDAMGGRIDFTSEEGVGTTFCIELPLASHSASNSESSTRVGSIEHTQMAGRVLYVEDNPENISLMKAIFWNFPKIEFSAEQSGEMGIATARKIRPDLILMDINLPGMNGFEALAELKRYPETYDIPVIAISADAMPIDVERGIKSGFQGYFTKPYNVSELLYSITQILTERER